MAYPFKFPDVGEGIHEGRIVEWLVAEGSAVAMDQPFVKVETDKAVVELPVPKAGVVLALHFKAGDIIHVGDVLVTFGEAGESAPSPPRSAAPAPLAPAIVQATVPAPAAPAAAPVSGRVAATPHTRALARRLGVDLKTVAPSGRSGRVTDEDVERAASGPPAAPPSPAPGPMPRPPAPAPSGGVAAVTEDGPVERVALTHLRKVIADAMHHSVQTSAHVTHVDEADVTELWAAYQKTKPAVEAEGVKFSILPFFVKAAVAALQRHPAMNASYDEKAGELVLKKYYHIGVAVDTPEGLVVPVLRDADKKDMVQIAREVADLAARARERRLQLSELRGASFTLTNIGPIGGVFATPILHQPEMAIVGLHTIKDRPAVVDGQVVARKMMYLSVSFDHRFVDGAAAARFMADLVKMVENPFLLLARV